jgi:hypothetical protein
MNFLLKHDNTLIKVTNNIFLLICDPVAENPFFKKMINNNRLIFSTGINIHKVVLAKIPVSATMPQNLDDSVINPCDNLWLQNHINVIISRV